VVVRHCCHQPPPLLLLMVLMALPLLSHLKHNGP
jgi:hypothetical protein